MRYEKLKKLEEECEYYKKLSKDNSEIPPRIINDEKWSIGKSVELTLAEMRKNDEYAKVSPEDKEIIKEIFDFLNVEALTRD